MTAIALDLTELDATVTGPVYAGDHPDAAAEAANHNVAVTHRPAVVVGATSASDVVAAVRFAARNGLPVAVQGTTHGAMSAVEGALLITTTRMDAVQIDVDARTARVGAGVRWRAVIDAAAPHGLAPLCGSSSHVGVLGYTTGGGLGVLGRQYGFAADQVVSVTMVTADGELRTVDAAHDQDLFWAVRGGRGNFGIVTELEFRLAPVATLYGASLYFDAANAGEILRGWRDVAGTFSERTSTSVAVLRLPPFETLPPPLRGRNVVHVRFAHNGTADEGAALLAPLLELGEIVLHVAQEIPFAAVDMIHNDPTDPAPVFQRGTLLRELTDDAIDAIMTAVGPDQLSPLAMVELRQLGGALARPPAVPNAVSGREGAFSVLVVGILVPEIAEIVPVAGGALLDSLTPWKTGTALVNFLGSDDSPEQVRAAWRPEVRERLVAIKRAHDPQNMFRFGTPLI